MKIGTPARIAAAVVAITVAVAIPATSAQSTSTATPRLSAGMLNILTNAQPPALETQPTPANLRISVIGDSIGGSGLGAADGCGYRPELSRLLANAGVTTTFTGPVNGGYIAATVNDCPTGFHGCVTVQDLMDCNPDPTVTDGIDQWMAAENPDVVIIYTGTNNAAGTPPGLTGYQTAYTTLVSHILAYSPTVQVIVGLQAYGWAGSWTVNQVQANIYNIYTVWSFPSRVTWADMQRYPPCLLWDGVHPSDYVPFARVIYAVLAGIYGLPTGPRNSIALRGGDWRPGYERAATDRGC